MKHIYAMCVHLRSRLTRLRRSLPGRYGRTCLRVEEVVGSDNARNVTAESARDVACNPSELP